jgi:integrase
MPITRKGARLWFRPARRDRRGKIVGQAVYIILDGGKHFPTGCFAGEAERAERALAEYISGKYRAPRKERELESISVADVLSIYGDDCPPKGEAARKRFDGRIGRLNDFFGAMTLSNVNGETCRAYAAARGNDGGARRDLEDLRSAINHHAEEGFHRAIVRVALPEKGPPRDRWLTRSEAAKLLWTCWRHREVQLRHRGPQKGRKLPTGKFPLRHVGRFIMIALYTGTRAGAIASASPRQGEGRSFVDLESGLYYRLRQGATPTKKRQPPAPIPPRLLAHMCRWCAKGVAKDYFVEWHGKPISSVKTALNTAVRLAGLEGRITPHTFRHTAATWLMQNGVSPWRAAGFLGMSVETLDKVYGHHHPDYLADAADAIGHKPTRKRPQVISLEASRKRRAG